MIVIIGLYSSFLDILFTVNKRPDRNQNERICKIFMFQSAVRLGLYIVTDLLEVLLGNGSASTFQHAAVGELCFLLHLTARC
jgi:hypothetical protein